MVLKKLVEGNIQPAEYTLMRKSRHIPSGRFFYHPRHYTLPSLHSASRTLPLCYIQVTSCR
jgi:hypothetical protein